jgi:hypothetical protein
MKRLVIVELGMDDEREFGDILHAFGTDNLRGCKVHVAIREAADAVLAALPHLAGEQP